MESFDSFTFSDCAMLKSQHTMCFIEILCTRMEQSGMVHGYMYSTPINIYFKEPLEPIKVASVLSTTFAHLEARDKFDHSYFYNA